MVDGQVTITKYIHSPEPIICPTRAHKFAVTSREFDQKTVFTLPEISSSSNSSYNVDIVKSSVLQMV